MSKITIPDNTELMAFYGKVKFDELDLKGNLTNEINTKNAWMYFGAYHTLVRMANGVLSDGTGLLLTNYTGIVGQIGISELGVGDLAAQVTSNKLDELPSISGVQYFPLTNQYCQVMDYTKPVWDKPYAVFEVFLSSAEGNQTIKSVGLYIGQMGAILHLDLLARSVLASPIVKTSAKQLRISWSFYANILGVD